MLSDITITIIHEQVDVDTGELVSLVENPFTGSMVEVRSPVERLLGWKNARWERINNEY